MQRFFHIICVLRSAFQFLFTIGALCFSAVPVMSLLSAITGVADHVADDIVQFRHISFHSLLTVSFLTRFKSFHEFILMTPFYRNLSLIASEKGQLSMSCKLKMWYSAWLKKLPLKFLTKKNAIRDLRS